MRCHRCGADNPPTDKYCGQCGRPLEEPSKLQRASEAVGWLAMASGLVILALAALYYLSGIVMYLWSIDSPLLNYLYANLNSISGEGFKWPGLTVGALLGTLGILIYAWPRVRVPGGSGKGIKALMFTGGLIVLIGAIMGFFPIEIARTLEGETRQIAMGVYRHGYLGVVLTGLAITLGAAVWESWKGRRWGMPSTATAENDPATDGNESGQ